jgi:O-acetyl-ADP-ribose deacetylase
MQVELKDGDLLLENTDAIVNPWNRNIIPFWLLIPCGVSGAIKRKGGLKPFWELQRVGPMPLGSAVSTSAGRLPYKAIIHVAGINMLWCASRYSIEASVRNAVRVAEELQLSSLAFPIIGSGSGGFHKIEAEKIMLETMRGLDSNIKAVLVRFARNRK